jgi:class 3 adenylate cyclase
VATEDIVTVVFTDIEGSTVMRNELGDDRANEVLERHDVVVTECVTERGGRIVKHTGDGIMVSFRSARGAVESAVAIQRQLDRLRHEGQAVPSVRIGANAGGARHRRR